MITVRLKVISYDKETNTCKAQLLNGDIVDFDPFVGCAVKLTDDDYHNGKGSEIVGKSVILTQYTVYHDNVVPHQEGMFEIE